MNQYHEMRLNKCPRGNWRPKVGDLVFDHDKMQNSVIVELGENVLLSKTYGTGPTWRVPQHRISRMPKIGDFVVHAHGEGWLVAIEGNFYIICDGYKPNLNHPIHTIHMPLVIGRSDFQWARWQLYLGFKVRRRGWQDDFFTRLEGEELTWRDDLDDEELELSWVDIQAEDWEIMK